MKSTKQAVALTVAVVLGASVLIGPDVFAHCQIPCGIYDDHARFVLLNEHITTIEKSMNQINELSNDTENNANQLVRWVMNKENHADEMAGIITKYFLQQRIKPEDAATDHAGWVAKVTACHHILVSSMKCKQTTDLAHVANLRKHVRAFAKAYLSEEDLKHLNEHHKQ
jgi:nickel superoxide dismutase